MGKYILPPTCISYWVKGPVLSIFITVHCNWRKQEKKRHFLPFNFVFFLFVVSVCVVCGCCCFLGFCFIWMLLLPPSPAWASHWQGCFDKGCTSWLMCFSSCCFTTYKVLFIPFHLGKKKSLFKASKHSSKFRVRLICIPVIKYWEAEHLRDIPWWFSPSIYIIFL